MPTDYPIEITDPDGSVRIAGLADFTDPDNQPAGANQPFKPAAGETVTVVEDAVGDAVLVYDDDAGAFSATGALNLSGSLIAGGNVNCQGLDAGGGPIDDGVLGSAIAYVSVGTTDPTTYTTPIVVNTTALTGGSFAWDGAAYQRISAALT